MTRASEKNPKAIRALHAATWLALVVLVALGGTAGAQQPRGAAGEAALRLPPDGTPVVEVVVEGVRRTSEADVTRVMSMRPGETFTAEKLRRDIQAIADVGTYNPLLISVQAEGAEGGVLLRVRVRENPVVQSVQIIGNVAFESSRLMRELDFAEGDLLPVGARSATRRSLRQFYANGGYKAARVTISIEPADTTDPETAEAVNVQVIIDEGERIRIRDLVIEGNEHFSDFRIRLWAANSGSWLFFNNYFDDRAFDDDLRTVQSRYLDAGYLDAVVRRGEFVYDERKAEVSPVMVVTEGPRYTVEDVQFTGATLFNTDELAEPFLALMGNKYNGRKVREAVQRLRVLYGNEGYVNAVFSTNFVKDAGRGAVVLDVTIEEADVVYVGRIAVEKQEYDAEYDLNVIQRFVDWTSPGVKEETVLREVQFEPGQVYRTEDEVATVRRLRGLGFFESVNVRREPTANPRVDDVVVSVEEDPGAGFVGITAGVGQYSGPAVSLSYVNPNLFGEARVLKAGATLGSRTTAFNVGYLDRYVKLIGEEDSLEVQLYRDTADFRRYAERLYGGWVEAGHPLSEEDTAFLRLRVEHVNLKRKNQRLRTSMDDYWVLALRPMVVRDTRDDRRWTTAGYYASAGVELGYADGAMAKLLHGFEWFKALDRQRDWVYRYSHDLGIQPYRASSIGLTERFFLGGRSLRGFAVRGAGPKDKGKRDVTIGGTVLFAQRHELRRRFDRHIQGRVFVDAGVIEDGLSHWGAPRVAAGVGGSFDLGPFVVEVDVAPAVVKRSRDRTQLVGFRIRSAF